MPSPSRAGLRPISSVSILLLLTSAPQDLVALREVKRQAASFFGILRPQYLHPVRLHPGFGLFQQVGQPAEERGASLRRPAGASIRRVPHQTRT